MFRFRFRIAIAFDVNLHRRDSQTPIVVPVVKAMTGMLGWEGLSFPGCQKIREFHRIHRLLDASITEYGLKLVLKAMNSMNFGTFLAVMERKKAG